MKESEQLLRRMKDLSSKEEKDRLEIINSLFFNLNVLERSLHGWRQWVQDLSFISKFSLEELMEMEESLEKLIQPFVKYDIDATQKWSKKFPQVQVNQRRREAENQGMYV